MSSIPTTALFVTKSGTDWSQDVTLLNLSEILTLLDVSVIDVDAQVILSPVYFTKTSATVLVYSGPDIGTDINLEIRRNTPINQRFYTIPHGAYLNSQALNEEIDRILKKLNEVEGFPGAILGSYILDQAYSAAWSSDNITTRTAQNLYNVIETKANVNNALLVEPTLDEGRILIRPDITDDSSLIPTTQWVNDRLDAELPLYARLQAPNFTGTPTAFTQPLSSNNLAIANTEWVTSKVAQQLATVNVPNALRKVATFTGNDVNTTGSVDLSSIPVAGPLHYLQLKWRCGPTLNRAFGVRFASAIVTNGNRVGFFSAVNNNVTHFAVGSGFFSNTFLLGYMPVTGTTQIFSGSGEYTANNIAYLQGINSAAFVTPGVEQGRQEIFSFGSSPNYSDLKGLLEFFCFATSAPATALAIPSSFVCDVFTYAP